MALARPYPFEFLDDFMDQLEKGAEHLELFPATHENSQATHELFQAVHELFPATHENF